MPKKRYWIYILHCENNTYYTGYTTDLTRRFNMHVNGTASKYTRSFKPLGIAQSWYASSKSMAMKIEFYIKQLSKSDKQELVLHPEQLTKTFPCKLPL